VAPIDREDEGSLERPPRHKTRGDNDPIPVICDQPVENLAGEVAELVRLVEFILRKGNGFEGVDDMQLGPSKDSLIGQLSNTRLGDWLLGKGGQAYDSEPGRSIGAGHRVSRT